MNNTAYCVYIIFDYESIEGWVLDDLHVTKSAHQAKLFETEELAENYCSRFQECTISIIAVTMPIPHNAS